MKSKGTPSRVGRRSFLATALAGAAASATAAQRDWSGKNPIHYPDPDIISLDKRFEKYWIKSTPIERLYTGLLCRRPRLERCRALPRFQ